MNFNFRGILFKSSASFSHTRIIINHCIYLYLSCYNFYFNWVNLSSLLRDEVEDNEESEVLFNWDCADSYTELFEELVLEIFL